MKHSLDRYTCGIYTRSTVVVALSILCEAVSVVKSGACGRCTKSKVVRK